LIDEIKNDLKQSMLAKEKIKTSTLRLLISSIHNREIEKGEELKEDEILAVTSSEVKKRRESVEEYKKAEREELAQKEEDEIKVLQKYLPEQLSDAELEEMTKAAITETESSGKKDIGKVMQNLMPKVKGRADGRKINQIAIKLLVDK